MTTSPPKFNWMRAQRLWRHREMAVPYHTLVPKDGRWWCVQDQRFVR